MTEKHYDGDSPLVPLPKEHFTLQQQEEARDLGDGSPGVDPRAADTVTDDGGSDDSEDGDDETAGL